jgi:hypothetical protein
MPTQYNAMSDDELVALTTQRINEGRAAALAWR